MHSRDLPASDSKERLRGKGDSVLHNGGKNVLRKLHNRDEQIRALGGSYNPKTTNLYNGIARANMYIRPNKEVWPSWATEQLPQS